MDKFERRLLLVADKLDVVHATMPRERFNFSHWVGGNWLGKEDLSCGTSACALGFATTIPELRKLGLCLVPNKRQGGGHVAVLETTGSFTDDIEKVAGLFDLSDPEFEFLFIPASDQLEEALEDQEETYGHHAPGRNASAKEVADHIRLFIQHKYH